MSHTPFPWKRDKYNTLQGPNGKTVTVWGFGIAHGQRSLESEANTALFEAAPDLLDALNGLLVHAIPQERFEQLRKGIGTATREGNAILNAQAAIDKALGGAK